MNIIYKNYVAPDYIISKSEFSNIFFRSTDEFSDDWGRNIVLSKDIEPSFDDDVPPSPSPNLCEELINVKDVADALAFTKKYGALINTKLFKSPFSEKCNASSISSIVNDVCGFNTISPFDLVLYEHFMFYQYDLYYIQLIHSKLSSFLQDNSSVQFFLNLLEDTAHLLTNPHLNLARYMEYENPKISEIVDNSFPYSTFRFYIDEIINPPYALKSDNDSNKAKSGNKLHDINFQYIFDKIEKIDVNIFPETFPYGHFIDAIKNSSQSNDYWLDYRELIIQFAELLYKDILFFHLREITPYFKISAESADLSWNFPSLAHAIFFDFYIQITGNSTYKICANENCRKIFLCKGKKQKRKIYCSNRCAHNTTNRKSIRKRREQLKYKTTN